MARSIDGQGIIIHIGAQKAASSTLQKAVFNNMNALNYLGLSPAGLCLPAEKIFTEIFKRGNDYSYDVCKEIYENELKDVISGDKPSLLSYELLTRVDVDLGRFSSPGIKEKASRVKNIFDKAKIILIIRNQKSGVPSLYFNQKYAHERCGIPFFSYQEWLRYKNSDGDSQLDAFCYYNVYKIYEELYGSSNVHVLVFEELHRNPDLFFKKFVDILGLDEKYVNEMVLLSKEKRNVRKSKREIYYAEMKSRLFPRLHLHKVLPKSFLNFVGRFLSGGEKVALPEHTDDVDFIIDYYHEQNRSIAKACGLNLEQLGYP